MLHPAILRRRRAGGNPLAAYALSTGYAPNVVLNAPNSVYAKNGTVQSSILDVFEFSRASTATYFDADGVLQTATSGMIRDNAHVYKDGSWQKRVLCESEARTNYTQYSQDVSNWELLQNVTATTGDTVAGITSIRITPTGGAFSYAREVAAGLSATSDYIAWAVIKSSSAAVWLRIRDDNTASFIAGIKFNFSSGTPTGGTIVQEIAPGAYLVGVPFTTLGTITVIGVYIYPDNSAGTNYADLVHLQIESGSLPSSAILTDGSVATRAAEVLTLPIENIAYAAGVWFSLKGEMTGDATLLRWYADANNYVTTDAASSQFDFEQADGGTVDTVSGGSYTSGVNVPISVASYHKTTAINGAADGTALTENATPTDFPDLSATDLVLGYDFMGFIEEFRMGTTDASFGDTELEGASA